jgi:hypothetical protein
MRTLPRARLLAIDPTRQGYAYVILESQILIDWGLVHAGREVDAAARRLDAQLIRYTPNMLIIEHVLPEVRRSVRAREFLVSVELLGLTRGIEIKRISQAAVKETFADSRIKHDIALALSDCYPELRAWRPRRRKTWTSEDQRMNIFDALALAETFLSSTDTYQPNHQPS